MSTSYFKSGVAMIGPTKLYESSGNFTMQFVGTATELAAVPEGVWIVREGDSWYNTDSGSYKIYDGSAWVIPEVETVRISSTDSPYSLGAAVSEVFADTDGGAITILLPAGSDGRKYRIINTGSSQNDITITPNGAELLTGDNASRTLSDKSVIVLTYNTTEGYW